jgi:drug/metabolite transporter (DMT)-like permease
MKLILLPSFVLQKLHFGGIQDYVNRLRAALANSLSLRSQINTIKHGHLRKRLKAYLLIPFRELRGFVRRFFVEEGCLNGDHSMPSPSTRYALVSIVMWASQALVLAKELPHVNLLIFLTLSFFIASISLSIIKVVLFISKINWRNPLRASFEIDFGKKRLYLLSICGVLYCVYHFLLFKAIEIGPVVTANLFNFLWPLFYVILAYMLLNERSNGVDATVMRIKLVLGFVGCVFLFLSGMTSGSFSFFKLGPILGLLAAGIWACFSILIKKLEDKKDFVRFQWIYYPFVATILCVISLFSVNSQIVFDTKEWQKALLPALYFGLGPLGLAMVFYDKAVHRNNAEKLGRLIFLTPLLSTLFLVFFADTEPLSIGIIFGGILVILVNMRVPKDLEIKTITSLLRSLASKQGNGFFEKPLERLDTNETSKDPTSIADEPSNLEGRNADALPFVFKPRS